MAGDVEVAVVSAKLAAGASATTDFTKTGFGTPKACIVLLTSDTTDDTSVATESKMSIGFSDFTDDFCITHQDEHSSAKVDCDALKSNTKCYQLLNTNASSAGNGTASTITDGVRLTNTDATIAAFATVIMFGGADLTVDLERTVINSSQDGEATVNASGTDGNDRLIFFIGADVSAEDSANTGINNSFGVCHITGTVAAHTITQRSMGWASDHNNAAGSPSVELGTSSVLNMITETGSQDWELEVTALASASTITVTTRSQSAGSGMEVYSLALDLDDRSAKVGSVDGPSGGSTWTPSVSLGFTPQYVGLGLTLLTTENFITSGNFAGSLGISSNTGSGEETCHSWYNEDAATTTNTNNLFRSRVIDMRDDDVTNVVGEMTHSSFNSGGWTYTIVDLPGTKKWFYWAIEEAAAPAAGQPTMRRWGGIPRMDGSRSGGFGRTWALMLGASNFDAIWRLPWQ